MSKISEFAKNAWKQLSYAKKKNSNNQALISNEQIPTTPFRIVGNDEIGYFITIRNYRLTEPTKNRIDAIEMLDKEMYNIILRMITSTIDMYEQMKQEPEQINNQ